jgi:hypothetical protein
VELQTGWRWCRRCQGLVFSGIRGVCFDTTPHDLSASGEYSVPHGTTPPGAQEGWRWCNRCQGLAFSGISDGHCFAGGSHDLSTSGEYSVPHGTTPPGAQEGWRWCNRCQGLAFSGISDGVCFDGTSHDLSESGDYSVPHQATPTKPRLKLEVEEQGRIISVSGQGYTPGGPVHIAYMRASKVFSKKLIADQDGRIFHEVRDTVAGDCLVIGRDETTKDFTADRTQRFHPRLTDDGTLIDHGTAVET